MVICIGAQKAGTTWLADYLRQHPQVHLPPVKEIHFFDARFAPKWCAKYEDEMLDDLKAEVERLTIKTCADPGIQHKLTALLLRLRMIASPSDYIRFMHWGSGDKPVLFEATPDYTMLPREGFQAMQNIYPDTRIIFLLRNPADRFLSSMRFNKTHLPTFDIEGRWRELMQREDFRLLTDYGRTIREAVSVFGREKLHLEFYERLFDQDAVDRICAFCGIEARPADLGRRSNASTSIELPGEMRSEARNAYGHVYREVAEFFAGDVPDSWRADLAALG